MSDNTKLNEFPIDDVYWIISEARQEVARELSLVGSLKWAITLERFKKNARCNQGFEDLS